MYDTISEPWGDFYVVWADITIVKSLANTGWRNIFQFNAPINSTYYYYGHAGDRIPSMHTNQDGHFYFSSLVNQNANREIRFKFQYGKTHHIRIKQCLKNNEKVYYEIYVDGEKIYSEENKNYVRFSEVKVYTSHPDKWSITGYGRVENFQYISYRIGFCQCTIEGNEMKCDNIERVPLDIIWKCNNHLSGIQTLRLSGPGGLSYPSFEPQITRWFPKIKTMFYNTDEIQGRKIFLNLGTCIFLVEISFLVIESGRSVGRESFWGKFFRVQATIISTKDFHDGDSELKNVFRIFMTEEPYQQIPAIHITKSKFMQIFSYVNNYNHKHQFEIIHGKEYEVEVKQDLNSDGRVYLEIFLNGQKIHSIENKMFQHFDVNILTSSLNWDPFDGFGIMKNFKWSTLEGMSCLQ